jgi:prephenate dehydrogenase
MRIVILGAGLMGSWLARELSREHYIAVYDVDKAKAKACGGVKVLAEPEGITLFNPEMLINAVSLQRTLSAFEMAAPCISRACIVADIASIKGEIANYYERSPFKFVSVHPMFGPTFADMEVLKEESAIIVKGSNAVGAQFFRDFFARLKVRIFEYSFDEHDRMMAYSLTIPFISSLAFAACVDSTAVPGTTFARHMSIARGLLSEDDHLLAEILFSRYSPTELDRVTAKLEHLKHIIRGRDYEEMALFLNRLRENIAPGETAPP